jgi:hypothetical protein
MTRTQLDAATAAVVAPTVAALATPTVATPAAAVAPTATPVATERRVVRRATPAKLRGVAGAPIHACAGEANDTVGVAEMSTLQNRAVAATEAATSAFSEEFLRHCHRVCSRGFVSPLQCAGAVYSTHYTCK